MAIGSSSNITNLLIRKIGEGQNKSSESFQKLSSGVRTNKASVDPAGLAVIAQLSTSIASLGQASRNISDTSSLVAVKDAALGQLGDLAGRKAELAQQAANGTLSDTDRLALNQEDAALTEEMNRIVATSEFNGVNVFDNSVTAQVGTDSSADSQLTVGGTDVASLVSSLSSQNISTQESARASLDAVQSFTSSIAQKRGEVGATQSRLSSVSNQVEDRKLNESQALSRIQDLDIAEETASLVRSKILTQSGSALLAQAGKLNADNIKSLLG